MLTQLLSPPSVQPIMPVFPSQSGAAAVGAAAPPAGKPNAVAVYDYDSKADGEISLRDGDDLIIMVPETDGWIKVRNLVSQGTGLVPASYIKAVEPDKSQPVRAGSQTTLAALPSPRGSVVSLAGGLKQGIWLSDLAIMSLFSRAKFWCHACFARTFINTVKAIYDFTATDEGELSFKAGDTIDVLDTGGDFSDEAWWEGRLARTGQSGQFPTVFTQGWQALKNQQSSTSVAPASAVGSMANLARAATLQSTHRLSVVDVAGSRRTSVAPTDTAAASRRGSAIPRPASTATAATLPTGRRRIRLLFNFAATVLSELTFFAVQLARFSHM